MSRPPKISLEFFPPRTEELTAMLEASLRRLLPYGPLYCTVSYGAGGSTREGTARWVRRIRQDFGIDCAPHLTHVSHTRDEVREIVRGYVAQGVRRMIALRGDIPADGIPDKVRKRGYSSTVELIADLRVEGINEVMVGTHPEHGGGDSASLRRHLEFVKQKLDAGATLAITQFFLDNHRYYRLRDVFAGAGMEHLLAPGIMPLHNYRQVFSFAGKTHVEVPSALRDRFQRAGENPDAVRQVAEGFSLDQVRDLADNGVERFHIYTMNRAPLTAAICETLGLSAPGTQS
ncbi:MAG: methylenetetrahydrofolate reductase [Gammaproteobacteria bacterium]|nr:methylenetetrahydrofolate reductase [Gammaproteobacteria bacterium]